MGGNALFGFGRESFLATSWVYTSDGTTDRQSLDVSGFRLFRRVGPDMVTNAMRVEPQRGLEESGQPGGVGYFNEAYLSIRMAAPVVPWVYDFEIAREQLPSTVTALPKLTVTYDGIESHTHARGIIPGDCFQQQVQTSYADSDRLRIAGYVTPGDAIAQPMAVTLLLLPSTGGYSPIGHVLRNPGGIY